MTPPAPNLLETLTGIGPVNAAKLRAANIRTAEELSAVGAQAAFAAIREQVDPGACFHLLLALEAAVEDVPKKEITPERRQELRNWYRGLD